MATELVEYNGEQPPAEVEQEQVEPVLSPADHRNTSIANVLDAAYAKASTLKLKKSEAEELAKDFPDEAFRLGAGGDPDLIYIEHAYLRQRLNQVLGVGASVPIRRREWSEPFKYWKWTDYNNRKGEYRDGVRIYVDLVLVVRGCVVGEAIGDAVYYPDNPKTNYSDALESAKSNAFRRCCKEFGVGLQAWMKGWGEGWKARNAPGHEPQKHDEPRKNATKQAQTKQKQQAAPTVKPFTLPPNWPHSTMDEMHNWIKTLDSSANYLQALRLIVGEDSPIITNNELEPLVDHIRLLYLERIEKADERGREKLQAVTREITDAWNKIQLDKQADEAFKLEGETWH